ncbi:MAG TPA: type I-E CRISPR-associated endoribonuclease Cas2 [Candidatus Ornithomonoglobus merdipullorum]|uniref:Type I-E CRISPR-associated endoribonuclease Cas2 n=1 Tax=Candidatus Ornithomonoglobus merdipullorum TaxID=2840895 RepID=A0A9D1SDM1_9FIRM|nr:type I-E CRISPR-associated endoribonuclease Cas2 [Candidatus Ornithomonoglobus merdipullorum]
MIVITMNNCPPKLRGDLSKWLFEINTGVFVGHVNARVREKLWDRICENIDTGQAAMVYSAKNEQHMEFRIHNSSWEPTDFDGLTLIKRPLPVVKRKPQKKEEELEPGFSKVAKRQMGRRRRMRSEGESKKYAFLDIETTGLDKESDEIIEIGVICTDEKTITERWSAVVIPQRNIPDSIIKLTGIDDKMIEHEGITLDEALRTLNDKICDRVTVIYNAPFDMAFLRRAEAVTGRSIHFKKVIDALSVARKRVDTVPDYKLETVAEYLDVSAKGHHRALDDCEILCRAYFKLNEF